MLKAKYDTDCITFLDGSKQVLSMREEETDNGVVIHLTGELRSDAAHDLYDEMIALVTMGVDITVDFKEVTYITATTQDIFRRVQLKIDSLNKGSLTLRCLPPAILREFESTGTSELLMIEE